jgi:hypothetical protein
MNADSRSLRCDVLNNRQRRQARAGNQQHDEKCSAHKEEVSRQRHSKLHTPSVCNGPSRKRSRNTSVGESGEREPRPFFPIAAASTPI